MPSSILAATATQFRFGYYATNGEFIGNFINGTGLTYDANGALISGTINYVKNQTAFAGFNVPNTGYFTLSQLVATDIATLAATNPDWWLPENFFALWDSVGGLLRADAPYGTVTGTDGNDRIDIFNSGQVDSGAGDDWIRGNFSGQEIYAGDGNDTVYSGDGPDSVYGGTGDDLIFLQSTTGVLSESNAVGGVDDDRIYGGAANEWLYGDAEWITYQLGGLTQNEALTDGNDTIKGNGGTDHVFGNGGNDKLYGGDGVDEVVGGTGDDILFGGNGDDYLYASTGNDRTETDEVNRVYGDAGTDFIYDSRGVDILVGGSGQDYFDITDGLDRAYGGAESNFFYVHGSGSKMLTGGGGKDYFYFALPDIETTSRIRDFTAEDVLSLNIGTAMTAQEQYDLFLAHASQVGANVIWTSGDGAVSIRIDNITLDDFSLTNFGSVLELG